MDGFIRLNDRQRTELVKTAATRRDDWTAPVLNGGTPVFCVGEGFRLPMISVDQPGVALLLAHSDPTRSSRI